MENLWDGVVDVVWRGFEIADTAQSARFDSSTVGTFTSAEAGVLHVETGVWGGPVNVAFALSSAERSVGGAWEESASEVLRLSSGHLSVRRLDGEVFADIRIPAGDYVFYVLARGREIARDLVADHAVESYFVQARPIASRQTFERVGARFSPQVDVASTVVVEPVSDASRSLERFRHLN